MRTLYAIIVWVCLLVLCAEVESMKVFIISKVIAGVLIVVFGKLCVKTFNEEELN